MEKLIAIFFRCPYKLATGKPCFFCGTTRSFLLVLHGNIREALLVNPVGVFLFLFIASVFVIVIGKFLARKLRGGGYGG